MPPGRSGDREAARRDQRERLFAALVAICDEKGYDATSVASLRCVEVYGAGPETIAGRDTAGMLLIADLVGPAYEDGLQASQLVIEASAGAIYGVLFEGVRSGDGADLPRLAPFLTYFALAPFIGAEQASDIANGKGRGR